MAKKLVLILTISALKTEASIEANIIINPIFKELAADLKALIFAAKIFPPLK